MAQEKYRLKNRFGLHVFLYPVKKLEYRVDCPDIHNMRAGIDMDTSKINMIDPEGGPFLAVGENNIDKIEIIDVETGKILKYTEQEGVQTAYKITFNLNGVPDTIIQDIF